MQNAWHGDHGPDADRASDEGAEDEIGCGAPRDLSVAEAIAWVHGLDERVTPYLCDKGDEV